MKLLTQHPISPLKKKQEQLIDWAQSFEKRFSTFSQWGCMKSTYALLGVTSVGFFTRRSLIFLKRLVVTECFLRKKGLVEKNPIVRVWSRKPVVCVALCTFQTFPETLRKDITALLNQKFSPLIEVSASYYEIFSPEDKSRFLYFELEKMRGVSLLPKECKKLEQFLQNQIVDYATKHEVFWPYNHEQAYKQIITLQKETSSSSDVPQVIIEFQKQAASHLEFSVFMVGPKHGKWRKAFDSKFPPFITITPLLKEELAGKVLCIAWGFILSLPLKDFMTKGSINLLLARNCVVNLLRNAIGDFRDYNGGLFELQKKAFKKISQKFEGKIPQFTFFAEELFYSVAPVEMQFSLGEAAWEEIFDAFSKAIHLKSDFSGKLSQQVYVLKRKEAKEITLFMGKAKKWVKSKKAIAYLRFDFQSESYLFLFLGQEVSSGAFFKKRKQDKKTLRISFESGMPPSILPYAFSLELRGRTLAKFLYEGLTRINTKSELEYASAEKVISLKEGSEYLITLRNSFWSNGQQVTAFDYERSWKRCLQKTEESSFLYLLKKARDIKKGLAHIDELGVQALDEKRLRVLLEKPDASFLNKLTTVFFSPFLEKDPLKGSFNGAYYIESLEKTKIVLKKNPYYWREKEVFFNQVILNFEVPPEAIMKAFSRKELDWIGNPCTWSLKITNPSSQKPIPYPFLLYFNTRYKLLSSRWIRQAFSLVLNRQHIATNIFPGTCPLYSPIPNLLSPIDSSKIEENEEQARKLFMRGLKELQLKKIGLLPLQITFCDAHHFVALANYLKKVWEKNFGIQILLDVLDYNRFFQKENSRAYQICGFFEGIPAMDKEMFLEKIMGFPGKNHLPNLWHNQEYTKTIHQMIDARSKEEKEKAIFLAERMLLTEVPFIPVLTRNNTYAHSKQLENYVVDCDGGVDFCFSRNKPI
ncbi:MAG: ABC transporter substrate-binding protein [Chlamydiota bacterium]